MSRLLLKANLESRLDLLAEVSDLAGEIKTAWEGIGSAP
jgi:flagellin-specific chaperone FliS